MAEDLYMRDSMASLFLILALAIALPLALISVVLGLMSKSKLKNVIFFFAVITVLLIVGTLVNGIIGNKYYDYDGHHPCTWVELGLSCGALTVGLFLFIGALYAFFSTRTVANKQVVEVVVDTKLDGDYAFVTACSNCGIGLWTSICVSFASILGVESKNYTKKLNKVLTAVREKLDEVAKANPQYDFRDFRVVKEGKVAYTGTMMGVKKK